MIASGKFRTQKKKYQVIDCNINLYDVIYEHLPSDKILRRGGENRMNKKIYRSPVYRISFVSRFNGSTSLVSVDQVKTCY